MIRAFAVLLFTLSLAACRAPAWQVHSIAACYQPSGSAELDRERSYLAALLALEAHGHTIVHASPPTQIEAEYFSPHEPDDMHTRWLVDVLPDASLRVDTVPSAAPVHERVDGWYRHLEHTTKRHRCRDINWLRWEAQNRGLVPIVLDAPSTPPSAPSAGGETKPDAGIAASPAVAPAPAAPPPAEAALPRPAAPARVLSAQSRALRDSLERERVRLSLDAPVQLVRVGAATLTGAIVIGAFGIGAFGLINFRQGCTRGDTLDAREAYDECKRDRRVGRAMLISGGTFTAASFALLATGLGMLIPRLRRQRIIDQRIRRIEHPELALDVMRDRFGLSLRAAF